MERAKKMVLISTENLDRLQQQGHSLSTTTSTTSPSSLSSSSATTIPSVSRDNGVAAAAADLGIETARGYRENTVRTPGSVLSRLDVEMHRILNLPSLADAREKWRMYREVLQRYLYFFREREKRRLREKYQEKYTDKANVADAGDKDEDRENTPPDNEDAEPIIVDDEIVAEDIPDLEPDAQPISSPIGASTHHRQYQHRHRRRAEEQKSVVRILNTIPKSFRGKARKLLAHLRNVAVPGRLNWDKHGVVSIDGKIIRGSNIAELLNDAARERKTVRAVARARFARLLRDVGTPTEYVGNQELLKDTTSMSVEEADLSAKLRETLPRGSSTPVPQASGRASNKRAIGETSLEGSDGRAVFVMNELNRDKTRVSSAVSKPGNKRRMIDWNPLEFSVASSAHNSSSDDDERRLPLARGPTHKRRIGETSLDERGKTRATYIAGSQYRHKTRVSDIAPKLTAKRRLINWNKLE